MHQHICWIPLSFFILCVYVMEKGLFIHLYYDFQCICSIFETEYLFHMYSTNCSSLLLFPPQGSAVEQLPWYLWWAAADVHCSGGSRICQGHPREHAQHSGHWPVYGCSQAAVYCSHSWEPPLFLPRWDNCEGFKKMFFSEDDRTAWSDSFSPCKSSVRTLCFLLYIQFASFFSFSVCQNLVVYCCQWFYITSTCICASRGSCSFVLGSWAAFFQ